MKLTLIYQELKSLCIYHRRLTHCFFHIQTHAFVPRNTEVLMLEEDRHIKSSAGRIPRMRWFYRLEYSHESLNKGDLFWEMCR